MIGIYIRVSTDEQASEGYSLAEQERQCRAYCTAHGWADVRVYADEGMSAFKDQLAARPALARLLEDVRAKRIGGVVVHKLDRFFRRAKLLIATVEELIDVLKVPFVSVSEQIDFSTPAPAYAVLVEAAARVIEGCPTGDEYTSITLPPRVYTV